MPTKNIDKLTIGAYSYIRSNSELLAVSDIGRFCSIGRNVTLGLNPRNHPIDWVSTSEHASRRFTPYCEPLKIGHDVWIGHDAVIMAGLSIGHGAVIGCNAIVTKDVAPYQIVAGNPAKKIRFRFSDVVIEQLLASRWWDYDIEQLRSIDFEDVDNFHKNVRELTKKADYSSVLIKNKKVSAYI
ncbi:MAG: CatB-related O-acetyltransferase [Methylophagaceae bacterium]